MTSSSMKSSGFWLENSDLVSRDDRKEDGVHPAEEYKGLDNSYI